MQSVKPKTVLLKEVANVANKQAVCVVKVVIVEEKRVVTRKDDGCELKIQDVNIADSSGSCRMAM